MYLAIGVEPTNEIAFTSGCTSSASTASLSPWTTLNTPSGSPASRSSSAIRSDSDGTRSEGFSTKVLPQAIATGNIHMGTIAGKLNGVMPAQTPTGSRSDQLSTPVPTLSLNSPLMQVRHAGRELDHLDAARDRALGVVERLAVLLGDDLAPGPSCCASISSRKRISTRARRSAGAARQPGSAFAAAATAASTSAALASGTWRMTSPVAGLVTSP